MDRLMKVHVAYLKKYYKLNKFIVSGRQVPRKGGIILCYADDLKEVKTIMNEDPFYINQAARYKIIPFLASMCSGNFKLVLNGL
jgi:uncharacterized protein YciI